MAQKCSNASVNGTFSDFGTTYIKLKTNSAGTTAACYTYDSQGTGPWAYRYTYCPSGTTTPDRSDYTALLTAYGGTGLRNVVGSRWGSYVWANDTYASDSSLAWGLDFTTLDTELKSKNSGRNVVGKV